MMKGDYERLAHLCYKFRDAVKLVATMMHRNIKVTYRDLMFILHNAMYCMDVVRVAKLLSKFSRSSKIKKLFLKSTGNKYQGGNQNIKLDFNNGVVRIRYPFEKSWLKFRHKVDKRVFQYKFDHYSIAISFRNGK